MPIQNRIKWKNVEIGDYGYISFKYVGNTDIRIVPRAKGVKIMDTTELGGGYLVITAHCFVLKSNRYTLEAYFAALDTTLTLNTHGDLTIYRGASTTTYSNCYLESYDQDDDDSKASKFELVFIKSL